MKAALPGRHYPLGAVLDDAGTNFALFAEHAEHVDVVLLDERGNETDAYELIDVEDYTFYGRVNGIKAGQRYGFRVHGKYDPASGRRYNANKLVLDPYAKAITGAITWGAEVFGYEWGKRDKNGNVDDSRPSSLDSARFMPQCVVVNDSFDWQGDRHPNNSWADLIIYETHVRGFTMRHPGVPEHLRGTYAGLANDAAVEYLSNLGVTAVELMPVHQFIDPQHLVEAGLRNYWGYDTIGYFAPHAPYAASGELGHQVSEFKGMVKALHRADIEVILDVVYNHTAEGDRLGPTLAFRGIDNEAYYRLVEGDAANYWDVTGCGNTLNVRHPQSLQLIMDSLRYWVTEMHVDGFRFDLASALARQFYDVDRLSAFFDIVHQDPVLSHVKLIAEPWDIGMGGYQVGNFPVRWAEWNGRYRDTVRDYWRGQTVGVSDMAYRLTGSSDLYQADGRAPSASINFITAHDGFTLHDLVAYNSKHNEANGEDNRDGSDDNRSWNCGAEGDTDDPDILELRARQQRNLFATTFISQGSPMFVSGDEMSRTQHGNNNAYCQDNELAWLDWENADAVMQRFAKRIIGLRHEQPVLRRRHFFQGQVGRGQNRKDIVWLRPDGGEMVNDDWNNERQSLGMVLNGDLIPDRAPSGSTIKGDTLLVLLHSHHEDVEWTMPNGFATRWDVILDTALPDEAAGTRSVRQDESLPMVARSLVILRGVRDESPPRTRVRARH